METILVIDAGTSGMRGTLFAHGGQYLFQARAAYGPRYNGQAVEQNPLDWLDALTGLTRQCATYAAQKGHAVAALATTCQRSSAIPVAADGTALCHAVMWQDKRCGPLCDELSAHRSFIYKKTGARVAPVYLGGKITWLRRTQPELYGKAHKIVTVADYLHYHMTGLFATDHTYGSRTLLMDLTTLRWDEELLRLFAVDEEKLCPLVPQGGMLGGLTRDFAATVGLAAGTPAISAGGDQQCGALGLGVIRPQTAEVTAGTGIYALAACDAPTLDPQEQLVCGVSAIPGGYVLEAGVPASSAAYNWFCRNFYSQENSLAKQLALADEEAARSAPGANGVRMLPHREGVFTGLTQTTTRGDMARAVLEGIAAQADKGLAALARLLPLEEAVRVSGGMTQSRLFNQIQADVYGRPVVKSGGKDATSLGAYLSAAVCLGWHGGYAEARDKSRQRAEQYAPRAENSIAYQEIKKDCARLSRLAQEL